MIIIYDAGGPLNRGIMRDKINRIRKTANNTLAMVAAPEAIPVKPNNAATIAKIKNIKDQYSIGNLFLFITYNTKQQ